jgi:tetratricopeptide (TPR) repeat protein
VEALVDRCPRPVLPGSCEVRLKQFVSGTDRARAGPRRWFDPVLVDYQTGLSYILEEKWQLAVESFDKVIAADSKFAHAYFYRGQAFGKLDRKDKMLVDLDLFVKLAPNSPEATIARANAGAQR